MQITDANIARLRAKQQQQQQQQQGQPATNGNPFFDPNGSFAQYLNKQGISLEEFYGRTEDGKDLFSSIRREREYVQPYLDQKWVSDNLPNLAGMGAKELARAKEEYMKRGRAMAMADHSDRQAEVTNMEKVGSVVNAGARGVVGLADSASGLVKTIAGKDNTVSEYIDAGVKYAKDALAEANSQEQQELVEYAQDLMSRGDIKKLTSLMVDFPTLLADQAVEQIGPLGVFSKGVGLAGKGLSALRGAEAANAVKTGTGLASKLANHGKVIAYSGYQMGGGMAQELAAAGIDPNSTGGIASVALAGLGGMAITAFTPATLEKHIMSNFLGKGLPEGTAKVLAQQTLQKLQQGGLIKTPVRYGTGLAKNALKGGVGEGFEEGAQSGLEGLARLMVNDDGSLRDLSANPITDQEMDGISKRSATGAFLGGVLGGTTRTVTNGFNRFGDSDKARLVKDNQQYWNDAQNGKFTGPATKDPSYDPETFNPDTLGKNERALYDLAQKRKEEIEAENAKKEADKQITDQLAEEYGSFSKTAKAEYDDTTKAKALTDEIDSIIDAIIATKADGVPVTKEEATAIINGIKDPVAKSAKLSEWAGLTNDPDLTSRSGAVAANTVSGYEFGTDGSYVNTRGAKDAEVSMTTAIEAALGRPVQDLAADIETAKAQSPEFAKQIEMYQKALQSGYINTAKEIADSFQKTVTKHLKNNPPPKQPKYSDTVNNSRRANAQNVGTIVQAMYGAGYWRRPNNKNKYKEDPIGFIDGLMDDVATTPANVLTQAEITEINTQLGNLKQAWENDQDYSMKLSEPVIKALTQVK